MFSPARCPHSRIDRRLRPTLESGSQRFVALEPRVLLSATAEPASGAVHLAAQDREPCPVGASSQESCQSAQATYSRPGNQRAVRYVHRGIRESAQRLRAVDRRTIDQHGHRFRNDHCDVRSAVVSDPGRRCRGVWPRGPVHAADRCSGGIRHGLPGQRHAQSAARATSSSSIRHRRQR